MHPAPWMLIAVVVALPIAALAEPIACPQFLPGVRVSASPVRSTVLPPGPARLTEDGLLAGALERQVYLRAMTSGHGTALRRAVDLRPARKSGCGAAMVALAQSSSPRGYRMRRRSAP